MGSGSAPHVIRIPSDDIPILCSKPGRLRPLTPEVVSLREPWRAYDLPDACFTLFLDSNSCSFTHFEKMGREKTEVSRFFFLICTPVRCPRLKTLLAFFSPTPSDPSLPCMNWVADVTVHHLSNHQVLQVDSVAKYERSALPLFTRRYLFSAGKDTSIFCVACVIRPVQR